MKTGKRVSAVRKGISAVLGVLLFLASGTAVTAGMFDEYEDRRNPDGTYSYCFAQGVTVTMDEDWHQHTLVVPNEYGATFYHKASYEKYEEQGYEGGRLFTLAASADTGFRNLPRYAEIGYDEDEGLYYYAVLPTDLQAWMEDAGIAEEYQRIYQGVNDVIAGIERKESSSDAPPEETAEETSDGYRYYRMKGSGPAVEEPQKDRTARFRFFSAIDGISGER